MPESLVNQIIMIWSDALPEGRGLNIGKNHHESDDAWRFVERVFQREHGIRSLYDYDPDYGSSPDAEHRVTHF
jgi:hypothetical protein